jgi:hypothetical protein
MFQSNIKSSGQIPLPIQQSREVDRNFEKGGRSFYFFDFDDNVAHLPSKIFIFHKSSGEELALSTTYFAEVSKLIGKAGTAYEDFEIRETHIQVLFEVFEKSPRNCCRDALNPSLQIFLKL